MEQTTLTSKGQVTIPKTIRNYLDLHTGDKIAFVINENNEVMLKPVTKTAEEVYGLLYQADRKSASVEDMDAAIGRHLRHSFR